MARKQNRSDIPVPQIAAGADGWQSGKTIQLEDPTGQETHNQHGAQNAPGRGCEPAARITVPDTLLFAGERDASDASRLPAPQSNSASAKGYFPRDISIRRRFDVHSPVTY